MLYQLSYLGTVCGKKSEALLQDRPIKIKLPGHPRSKIATRRAVAEREGFEPSVEVLPLRRFSKPLPSATRPPLHRCIVKTLCGRVPRAECFVPDCVPRQYAWHSGGASSCPALPQPSADAAARDGHTAASCGSCWPEDFFHFLERASAHDEVTRRRMPEIAKATVVISGACAGGLKGGAHLSPGPTVAGFEARAHPLGGEWGQVREHLDTDAIERDAARLSIFV